VVVRAAEQVAEHRGLPRRLFRPSPPRTFGSRATSISATPALFWLNRTTAVDRRVDCEHGGLDVQDGDVQVLAGLGRAAVAANRARGRLGLTAAEAAEVGQAAQGRQRPPEGFRRWPASEKQVLSRERPPEDPRARPLTEELDETLEVGTPGGPAVMPLPGCSEVAEDAAQDAGL